jgi:hypothetical protein
MDTQIVIWASGDWGGAGCAWYVAGRRCDQHAPYQYQRRGDCTSSLVCREHLAAAIDERLESEAPPPRADVERLTGTGTEDQGAADVKRLDGPHLDAGKCDGSSRRGHLPWGKGMG